MWILKFGISLVSKHLFVGYLLDCLFQRIDTFHLSYKMLGHRVVHNIPLFSFYVHGFISNGPYFIFYNSKIFIIYLSFLVCLFFSLVGGLPFYLYFQVTRFWFHWFSVFLFLTSFISTLIFISFLLHSRFIFSSFSSLIKWKLKLLIIHLSSSLYMIQCCKFLPKYCFCCIPQILMFYFKFGIENLLFGYFEIFLISLETPLTHVLFTTALFNLQYLSFLSHLSNI